MPMNWDLAPLWKSYREFVDRDPLNPISVMSEPIVQALGELEGDDRPWITPLLREIKREISDACYAKGRGEKPDPEQWNRRFKRYDRWLREHGDEMASEYKSRLVESYRGVDIVERHSYRSGYWFLHCDGETAMWADSLMIARIMVEKMHEDFWAQAISA